MADELPVLRLVFAGTPEFAVPSLEACAASGHRLAAVYTQPDRPAGRGRRPRASPVKARAAELGVRVRQPQTLRDADEQAGLAALSPDLMVVVAYGLILPPAVLRIPRLGCVNVHASLLPRWRGAAPIQRAVEAGDARTGVTLMQMAAGLDTGPVLAQRECPIAPCDTAGELHDRLARLGGDLLAESLDALARGALSAAPQDTAQATYAAKLDKAEGRLNWDLDAAALARRVQAFNPWPVAYASLDNERVRVWRACARPGACEAAPGTVLAAGRDGVDVATGKGVLRIAELQWPGGRRLSAGEAANGRRLHGRRFR